MPVARTLPRICAALSLAVVTALATPPAAHAFCGFYVSGADARLYNHATMVVLMREGTRTVLSMQNNYEGPPENFAMVVPVPVVLTQDNVRTLRREVFERVERLAAPRLVEYWEQDPCAQDTIGLGAIGTMGHGSGTGQGYGSGAGRGLGVTVEAQFQVGEYQIVILSAQDSAGLDTWLRRERYHIPDGAAAVLEPYVRAGSKFFVARVDAARVRFENGRATLSPLRFHYDTESFSLPIRLGLLNSPGTQDLLVHVLAPAQRYEVANRPNVTIPTNLDVADQVRSDFAGFYAALFDRTLAQHPGAVVTEYAWAPTSCDPCPGPVLDTSDMVTLGGDVLPSTAAQFGGDAGAAGSALVPFVRAAPPVVTGLLAPEAIRRVVLRNLNQVRFCYEQAYAQNPSVSARVVARFTIGPDGAVADAPQVAPDADSGAAPATMTACIANAVRRWQFPSPENGTRATVAYPFVLQLLPRESARGFGSGGAFYHFVLTRLHARYGREGVGDDLVFRTAEPITGGREMTDATGALEHGARPSPVNNFQGRYAIRHAWTGAMNCEHPQRGVWGGPPSGVAGGETSVAVNTAFASRTGAGAQLASLIRSSAPELALSNPQPASAPAAGAAGQHADASVARAPTPGAAGASARGGCGRCEAGRARGRGEGVRAWGALAALGVAAGALVGRRRRRASRPAP